VIDPTGLVRQADENASEKLLGRLHISVKRMSQEHPTSMDSVSSEGQNAQRATLNEGGFRGNVSKPGIIRKAFDLLEHRKTPYSSNRWVLCPETTMREETTAPLLPRACPETCPAAILWPESFVPLYGPCPFGSLVPFKDTRVSLAAFIRKLQVDFLMMKGKGQRGGSKKAGAKGPRKAWNKDRVNLTT
jgi:hypothetical protein